MTTISLCSAVFLLISMTPVTLSTHVLAKACNCTELKATPMDYTQLEGIWYARMSIGFLPPYMGSQLNITYTDENKVLIQDSILDLSNQCMPKQDKILTANNSFLDVDDYRGSLLEHHYGIINVDNTTMILWFGLHAEIIYFDQYLIQWIHVYTKNEADTLDMDAIQQKLKDFCPGNNINDARNNTAKC